MHAIDEYAPGEHLPLGSYAALSVAFSVLLVGLSRHPRSRRVVARATLSDAILYALSVHKISRVVARERVTSPLRAPFVRKQAPGFGGSSERARGRGLRQAIGDLLRCNYCVGPWIATGLLAGYVSSPTATRVVMSVFAATAASDFLHRFYDLLDARRQEATGRAHAGRVAWHPSTEAPKIVPAAD